MKQLWTASLAGIYEHPWAPLQIYIYLEAPQERITGTFRCWSKSGPTLDESAPTLYLALCTVAKKWYRKCSGRLNQVKWCQCKSNSYMQGAERDIALTKASHIFRVAASAAFPIFPPSDCLRVSRMEWPFKRINSEVRKSNRLIQGMKGQCMSTLFFFDLFCSIVNPRGPPCEV